MTAKDLKNALLQEAVQGKLVPQIASEGNARDLLEEIRRSRHSELVSESKNKPKKEKLLPEISEEDIPFDIPDNWCWCRLGEIFETTSGTTPQSKNPIYYNNGTIGWVRTTDLNNGILSFSEIKITEKAKTDCNLKMIPKNSVCIALYGGAGTIGKNAILNFETTINQSVCAMLPNTFADMRYLQYFLQWQRPYWMNYASGSRKDPNINQIIVKNCPFPLPPLAEQKRIVSALEKFMPLIEEYGKKETELKAFNKQIGTLTKKAILQEAIQGKLVPQIAAEGNAKDLLEEIKKEKSKLIKEGKIKKEKTLPEIAEDEIPFDIPENWCWCRLGDIVDKLTDGTHRTPKYVEKGIPFLSVKNLSSGKMDFDNTKFITPEEHKELYARCNPEKGDMLLTKVGTTGIPVINDSDIEFSLFVSVALIKFNHDFLDAKFFLYLLQSPLVQEQAKENTRGVGNKNWVMEAIANTILVLPPLAEQKRMVAAIEKMLPLCVKLGE